MTASAANRAPLRLVTVDLVGRDLLPAASRMQLAAQVQRIWEAYGIQVDGLEHPVANPAMLRVELTTGDDATAALLPRHRLGAFDRSDTRITISLPVATEMARAGLPLPESLSWPDIRRDFALGNLIGHAIAHEIGHYLLGPRHMSTGLMRAAFRPNELVDPRNTVFALTHTDIARLTAVLQAGTTLTRASDQRAEAWTP